MLHQLSSVLPAANRGFVSFQDSSVKKAREAKRQTPRLPTNPNGLSIAPLNGRQMDRLVLAGISNHEFAAPP
jgi:hypothetical protein